MNHLSSLLHSYLKNSSNQNTALKICCFVRIFECDKQWCHTVDTRQGAEIFEKIVNHIISHYFQTVRVTLSGFLRSIFGKLLDIVNTTSTVDPSYRIK